MMLSEMCEKLNISIAEELWEKYYPIPQERTDELCTEALLQRLETRFGMFGKYYDAVKEGLADMQNHPEAKLYMDMLSLYMRDCTTAQAKAIAYPARTDAPAFRMLTLLVHLPSIENLYDKLCLRGFTHEEACHTLSIYKIYLWETENHREGYVGISPFVSQWMSQFTKGEIYYPGLSGLNFQIYTLPYDEPYILRHRKTGELLPVFGNEVVFAKGGAAVLGSVGAEDPEGCFTTKFEETEDSYIGNPTRNCVVASQREVFSKNDWELLVKPGENVITTHIFWGSDFTPEKVRAAFAAGQRIARTCFAEYNIKAQRCYSWLMNPLINAALGDASKLSQFSAMFVRYPRKSAGKAYAGYVFPGKYDSYEALPENSSLQRAFKNHLLKGEYIYEYSGILSF